MNVADSASQTAGRGASSTHAVRHIRTAMLWTWTRGVQDSRSRAWMRASVAGTRMSRGVWQSPACGCRKRSSASCPNASSARKA